MENKIEKFFATNITKVSMQFENAESHTLDMVGSVEGETELITKRVSLNNATMKELSRPTTQTLTFRGHLPVEVVRKTYGVTNENLVEGVYSYGTSSISPTFTFVVSIVDEFDNVTKLMAWRKCSSTSGLRFTVNGEDEEIAQVELELKVMLDDRRKLYYEMYSNIDNFDELQAELHEDFDVTKILKANTEPQIVENRKRGLKENVENSNG